MSCSTLLGSTKHLEGCLKTRISYFWFLMACTAPGNSVHVLITIGSDQHKDVELIVMHRWESVSELLLHIYSRSIQLASDPSIGCQIREQNPELARESHVTRLTLDKVYDFALAPKENTPAEGVIFRFMPDAKQVRHALQVSYKRTVRALVQSAF